MPNDVESDPDGIFADQQDEVTDNASEWIRLRAWANCEDGAMLLAYLGRHEGERTPKILKIEISFYMPRLVSVGIEPEPVLIAHLRKMAEVLDPPREDIFDAAEKLGADVVYFTMVFQAATAIACVQRYEARLARQPMIIDSPTIAILRDVARFAGWL